MNGCGTSLSATVVLTQPAPAPSSRWSGFSIFTRSLGQETFSRGPVQVSTAPPVLKGRTVNRPLPTAIKINYSIPLAIFFLCGCAHTGQESVPYNREGTASIYGQALLKTRDGDIKYGAGEAVNLLPITQHSEENWKAALEGSPIKKQQNPGIWITTSDSEGRFEFRKIPAGEYFIDVPISWKTQYSLSGTTGTLVSKKVKVAEGESLKVLLTK